MRMTAASFQSLTWETAVVGPLPLPLTNGARAVPPFQCWAMGTRAMRELTTQSRTMAVRV